MEFFRKMGDNQERDPGDERAIGIAGDGLHQRLLIAATVKEATPGDEAGPDQHETGKRSKCEIRPDAPSTAILSDRAVSCGTLPSQIVLRGAVRLLPM
jgi:hypothetical protein